MIIRTILNIPSNSPKMLLNAGVGGADVILFDLEDGVAQDQKHAARVLLKTFLEKGLYQGIAMVRVNGVDTPHFVDDLKTVIPLPIAGIMLPKMERAEDIRYADTLISELEKEHQLEPGSRMIIGTAETPLGVENAYACLSSCERIVGCSFGSEDFAASMGIKRTASNEELSYARRRLVVAAKAAGKFAIDTVYTNVNDDAGLTAMAEEARMLGYVGKFIISPKQVETVNRVFTPTDAEISYARQVIEKMEEAKRLSKGVAVINGKMIDLPVYQQACHVLEVAELVGLNVKQEVCAGE